jgi:hypothetical protein
LADAEKRPMKDDPFEVSVANIRDTVKWLIASIGAIFVTLLAGVQFNHVPFATDPTVRWAGAAAALGVMITFGLAIRTLVGGAVSFPELAHAWRLGPTRRYLNRNWGGSKSSDIFERFSTRFEEKNLRFAKKTLAGTDPAYVEDKARAAHLTRIAHWHIVKCRFNLLAWAMLLVVPVELAAAGVMFSRPDPGGAETTLTIKLQRSR